MEGIEGRYTRIKVRQTGPAKRYLLLQTTHHCLFLSFWLPLGRISKGDDVIDHPRQAAPDSRGWGTHAKPTGRRPSFLSRPARCHPSRAAAANGLAGWVLALRTGCWMGWRIVHPSHGCVTRSVFCLVNCLSYFRYIKWMGSNGMDSGLPFKDHSANHASLVASQPVGSPPRFAIVTQFYANPIIRGMHHHPNEPAFYPRHHSIPQSSF